MVFVVVGGKKKVERRWKLQVQRWARRAWGRGKGADAGES